MAVESAQRVERALEIARLAEELKEKVKPIFGGKPDYVCGQRLVYKLYKLIVTERKAQGLKP